MFINCPSCRALVATDPATDLPPERCPRCAVKLREQPGAQAAGADSTQAAGDDARSGVAAAIAGVFDGQELAQDDPIAQPAVSMATLLQAEPEPAPAPVPVSEPETARAIDAGATPVPGAPPDAGPAQEPGVAPAPEAGAPVDAAVPAEPAPGPAPSSRSPRRAAGRAAPSFARRRRIAADDSASRRRWPIPAAIIGLGLLLALQWLLADRARLAADPGWRPVVAAACGVLRCSLPPWHEPSAFVLLERDVRPHPDAAGALRITASFRNDAAWAQAWPDVVLTLSDIDGRPLGTRAFTAAEYLDGAAPSRLLDSGQGAVIHMDVLEPGPGAVSFAFDFN